MFGFAEDDVCTNYEDAANRGGHIYFTCPLAANDHSEDSCCGPPAKMYCCAPTQQAQDPPNYDRVYESMYSVR